MTDSPEAWAMRLVRYLDSRPHRDWQRNPGRVVKVARDHYRILLQGIAALDGRHWNEEPPSVSWRGYNFTRWEA